MFKNEVVVMTKVVPVSELKSYSSVLNLVDEKKPVILTKNGYGKYAIVDLDMFDEMQEEILRLRGEVRMYHELTKPLHESMNGCEGMSLEEFKKKAGWK